jgi:nitrate reductase cytochrome c-type subunit
MKMTMKAPITVAASAFALILSTGVVAESAEKLEKAHEKAEAELTLSPEHQKAEKDVQGMDAKKEAKMEKAHEKAEGDLKKMEGK